MRARTLLAVLLVATGLLAVAAPASHAAIPFGLSEFDVTYENEDGSADFQAGSHPFAMTTKLHFNSQPTGKGGEETDEAAKDILVSLPAGFAGAPSAIPTCSTVEFLTAFERVRGAQKQPDCPDSTAIGFVEVVLSSEIGGGGNFSAAYNLAPPPGKAAKLGFWTQGVPVTIELGISESPPHQIVGGPTNLSQLVEVLGSKLTLWGVPADPAHDPLRGACISNDGSSAGSCPAGIGERPFLTLPRACQGPLATEYATDSWQHPAAKLPNGEPDLADPNWLTGTALTHDQAQPPAPQGFSFCANLGFNPEITAQPTARAAETGAGLDFDLDFHDEGLTNPAGIAGSDVKKAVVTLPRGVTINPSVGEGLGVCTPAQVARETAFSAPGEGCPDASKIGTLHVLSPLVEEPIDGQIYLAQQDDPATAAPGAENPFDSLIALYFVLAEPDPRGERGRAGQSRARPRDRAAGGDDRRKRPVALQPLRGPPAHRRQGGARHPGGLRHLHDRSAPHPLGEAREPAHDERELRDHLGHRRRPLPAGGSSALPSLLRSGSGQQQRRLLQSLQHAPDQKRWRTGHDQVLGDPASGGARLPGRSEQMPRQRDRDVARVEDRKPRAPKPLLPGQLPGRPHPGRSGSRGSPDLRQRTGLPRRPLPRRSALGDRDHPGGRRSLRRGNRRRPGGTGAQPEDRRSRSRRGRLRTDPPHHQGHRLEAARPARLRRSAELHLEPDLLRRIEREVCPLRLLPRRLGPER